MTFVYCWEGSLFIITSYRLRQFGLSGQAHFGDIPSERSTAEWRLFWVKLGCQVPSDRTDIPRVLRKWCEKQHFRYVERSHLEKLVNLL